RPAVHFYFLSLHDALPIFHRTASGEPAPMTRFRFPLVDITIVLALFVVSFIVSRAAMRGYRTAGIQPSFYQGNFEPAVMMTCGRGFISTTPQAVPKELVDFLN